MLHENGGVQGKDRRSSPKLKLLSGRGGNCTPGETRTDAQTAAQIGSARMQEHIVEMTGTTNPDKRAELWDMPNKRLYFMTPGTLKNDVVKGEPFARLT